MRKITIVGGLAALGVSVLAVGACGSDSDSLCEFQGTCGLSDAGGGVTDATTDGTAPDDSGPSPDAAHEAGDATPPAACDFTVDPVEGLCVTDALGIFVSASGTASGAGTKESPVSTISKGLALATSGKSHVYVCTGSYAENVSIGATQGVSLQGGFDCGTWTYAATNKVTVSPSSGYALEVNQATSPVTIEDVEFDAAAGTPTSVNSIAAFVNASPSVTLRRVVLTAAAGGTPANPAAPATNHTTDPLAGHSAGMSGPAGTTCVATCGDATTTSGGAGGDNTDNPTGGTPLLGGGSAGENNVSCGAGGTAATADGDPAPSPASSAPPAHAGSLTSTGWTPSAGASGSNGAPGQGGGGGGDKTIAGFGGGGACGGCGGVGGAAGAGGGASIALVTVGSAVALLQCTLSSSGGGAGATGTSGEAGQAGSQVPGGVAMTGGCTGGAGAAGAGGNGGGGGAGGVSFGLLFSGVAPLFDNASASTVRTQAGITIGAKGTAGAASGAGSAATGGNAGNAGAAGPAGLAAAVQQYESLP